MVLPKTRQIRSTLRSDAEKRQEVCNALTIAQRLEGLDNRPGESRRERERLNASAQTGQNSTKK